MLRLPLCSSGDLLCLWNNPASLPSWDSHCKPPALALQDNSSLGFSRHHSAGLEHLWGQKKTQEMDAGKCYPPSSIGACKESPVESTQCLTPVNRRLKCHELPFAQERYYRDGCLGMKLKKELSSKKEKKDQLSNSAAALKQLSREDRGKAASLNWEALVWERLQGNREGRLQQVQPGVGNHSHHQEPGPGSHSLIATADGHDGTFLESAALTKEAAAWAAEPVLGSWCIACLINLKPWLKVFPSSVYFYILFNGDYLLLSNTVTLLQEMVDFAEFSNLISLSPFLLCQSWTKWPGISKLCRGMQVHSHIAWSINIVSFGNGDHTHCCYAPFSSFCSTFLKILVSNKVCLYLIWLK